MLEKSKNLEKKQDLEANEKIGSRFLSRELDGLPDSPRSGGFLLTTLLAMGLAMVGTGTAEAQVRTGRFSISGPASGITGAILQQGRTAASQAMERKKAEMGAKIDHEFQKKIREIGAMKNQLEQDFRNKLIPVEEFETRKQQLDNELQRLSRERDIKMAHPLGVKGTILEGVIRGY